MALQTPAMQAERWAAAVFRVRALLRRYWWVLLSTTILGFAIAGVIVSRQETWYRSAAKLVVSGQIKVSEGNAYTEELSNFFGTQIELMRSAKVMEGAQARVQATGKVVPSEVSSFEVLTIPQTSVFVLRATTQTPEYSPALLDAVISEYISLKRGMRTEKSETTISALTDELQRQENEWQNGEKDLADFQKKHSLVLLKEGENAAAKYLAGLNDQLAQLTTQQRMFSHLELDQLRGLGGNPAAPRTGADGEPVKENQVPDFIAQSDYLKTQNQLQVLEQKRAQLSENLRDGHPSLLEVDDQIAEQKRLLNTHRELAKNEYELRRRSLESQIKAIQEEIGEWKTKALEIGGLMSDYARMQGRVDRAKSLYEKLAANMGSVDLTKNISQDIVSVLERPSAATPVRPGMSKVLGVGAAAGLLIGCAILYLLDRSSSSLASPEEFLALFDERIIGMVPEDTATEDVLRVTDTRHSFAEAFYNIRSSLFFLQYDGPMPKVILITSSIPNEGKSTLSTNIAIAFAFAGSRTLLIDGDLRRGEIHKKFGLGNEQGLSEVVQRKVNWREVVHSTSVPNLSLMTRGGIVSQPSKYLVHSSTDDLLRELHGEYDQVIIDSCPVLAADDTTSFAPKVEAVLVVARIGLVTRRHVAATLTSLRSRQANILGCVLNGVDLRMTAYSYSSYSQYYMQEEKPVESAKV